MTLKRFDYIDIAKGIGILLVVWAHILTTGWTHRVIYAFHMPLFFLLSGMLFKREKYKTFGSFIVKRARRLLIPYLVYSVVTWVIWAIFRYLRHDDVGSYFMPLLQTLISQGSGEFMVHNSALWFIPCLFLVEILYFFIIRLGKTWAVIISFLLATTSFLLGHLYGSDYWFTPIWNADAALIALPFYCVGNIFITNIGHQRVSDHISFYKCRYIIACIAMTGLLFWSSMSFGVCSMGSSSYQCNGIIFILRAFLGCILIILISQLISNIDCKSVFSKTVIKYFKWSGKKSLDIMCIHIPLKGICMIVVGLFLHTSVSDISNNLPYSSIAFILTMIACWFVIRFIVESIIRLIQN